MARRGVEPVSDFNDVVERYISAKRQEQEVNKVTKALGTEIKTYFRENNLTEYESVSGTRLNVQIRRSEKFDEESLIDYLKLAGLSRGLVKKKEYIDYDALESAIYRGKLSNEQLKDLDKFKTVTETQALVMRG